MKKSINPNPINPIIVIPARMKATRLPNKPLMDIHGVPMIIRVAEQAKQANIAPVILAVCEAFPLEVISSIDFPVLNTDENLPSGTDRVYFALKKYDPSQKYNVVINVQGDLPFFPPHYLQKLLHVFENPDIDMATLVSPMTKEEAQNPHRVKTVLNEQGRALYFSRSPIPHGAEQFRHHIGVYAYKRDVLEKLTHTPPAPLEIQEKLEQIRALCLGMHIQCVEVEADSLSVDTPEDLEMARHYAKKIEQDSSI